MLQRLLQARGMAAAAAAQAGPIATSMRLKLQVRGTACCALKQCWSQVQACPHAAPSARRCTAGHTALLLWSPSAAAAAPSSTRPDAPRPQEALQPQALTIQNDSHKHAGHSGNPSGAPDAETHFT